MCTFLCKYFCIFFWGTILCTFFSPFFGFVIFSFFFALFKALFFNYLYIVPKKTTPNKLKMFHKFWRLKNISEGTTTYYNVAGNYDAASTYNLASTYDRLWASVMRAVPKLAKSESGRTVSEKVKLIYFDVYLSPTMWNHTK